MRSEVSSTGKLLFLFNDVIDFGGCCRLLVQDRALPSACSIFIAELVRDIQQHRLLQNIEGSQLSRIATVSTCLASSDECHKAFICLRKKLSHNRVFLALVYFTSAKLYKALLDEEFCTGILTLCTRLFLEQMETSDSCRAELSNAAFALLEAVKSAVTVPTRFFIKSL